MGQEKWSICVQRTAPGVSVAQVARRYSERQPDIHLASRPALCAGVSGGAGYGPFPSVEIVDRAMHDNSGTAVRPVPAAGMIEIDTSGSQGLRISGAYDPEALAWLIWRLSE